MTNIEYTADDVTYLFWILAKYEIKTSTTEEAGDESMRETVRGEEWGRGAGSGDVGGARKSTIPPCASVNCRFVITNLSVCDHFSVQNEHQG